MQMAEPEEKDVSSVDPNEGRVQEKPQLEVDLTEDDDGDEGPSTAPEPEGRRARRARRIRELDSDLKKERETRQTMERELAELRGRVSAIQSMPREPAQAEADPYEPQITALDEQQDAILTLLRSDGVTESRVGELRGKWKQLERQKRKLEYKQAASSDEERGGGGLPSRTEYENQMLSTEFPDVFGDRVRLQEAKTELLRLQQSRGLPINYATARMAAKTVQDRYTRKPSAPSSADKAKFAGESGRAGAGGSSGRFAPNKGQLNAARAFTSHLEGLSDEERVKIWATKVGKKRGLI
jgi:hypothetical protein